MPDGPEGVGTGIRRAPSSHPNGPERKLGETVSFYFKGDTHS